MLPLEKWTIPNFSTLKHPNNPEIFCVRKSSSWAIVHWWVCKQWVGSEARVPSAAPCQHSQETNTAHSPTVLQPRQSLISAWGQRSDLYIQVAPGDPCKLPSPGHLRLCLSSPRVLAGPWEEPGTHRHWLVVSNASTNSRFHGSQGGGKG